MYYNWFPCHRSISSRRFVCQWICIVIFTVNLISIFIRINWISVSLNSRELVFFHFYRLQHIVDSLLPIVLSLSNFKSLFSSCGYFSCIAHYYSGIVYRLCWHIKITIFWQIGDNFYVISVSIQYEYNASFFYWRKLSCFDEDRMICTDCVRKLRFFIIQLYVDVIWISILFIKYRRSE